MDEIIHYSHRHPLRLTQSLYSDWYGKCKFCHEWCYARDQIYSCDAEFCDYYLHKACGKLSEKMRHPFHPHHTLKFRDSRESIRHWSVCCACGGGIRKSFAYLCEECSYALDLKCAALTPLHELQETKILPMINHQHPLFACENQHDNDTHFRYFCNICGEAFQDIDHVYVCLECKSLMDEICISLPNESTHPFHLEHNLTLLHQNVALSKSHCHACRRGFQKRVYQCSLCYFSLDVHCATLLVPTARNDELSHCHSHPHPLIQCENIKNFRRRCFGCDLPFEDIIYVCLECGILLDKSCTDLPPDILHPFHPQHRLILGESSWQCKGCKNESGKFAYMCKECRFYLDLKCANTKFDFITSELHQHALAYFDVETRGLDCSHCHSYRHKFFFRCVDCDFNIHDHCYPSLPQTIKHHCHCDPLTLTRSQIKDIPDEDEKETEFYCHACEELRVLSDSTYYCAECHFVAHVHCVISEVISCLQKEPVDLANKQQDGKKKMDDLSASGLYFLSGSETSSGCYDTQDEGTLSGGGNSSLNPLEESENTNINPVQGPEKQENQGAVSAKEDPVLQELNERISALQNQVKAMTEEIANLEQRRLKHLAISTQVADEDLLD